MKKNILITKNLSFETEYMKSDLDKPFNFTLKESEVGVIPNGKLASQLGRFIFGKGIKNSGELIFDECIEYTGNHRLWMQNIGYCFREKGILATQSVFQNVNLPVKYYYKNEDLTAKALNDIGIDEKYWDLRPHLVSWQIRKKILIARSAVLEPKLLFLDDPIAFLDNNGKTDFDRWLKIQKTNKTAILMGLDDPYSSIIWADWVLDSKNEQNYNVQENYTEKQFKIANLLKEEFVEGL